MLEESQSSNVILHREIPYLFEKRGYFVSMSCAWC